MDGTSYKGYVMCNPDFNFNTHCYICGQKMQIWHDTDRQESYLRCTKFTCQRLIAECVRDGKRMKNGQSQLMDFFTENKDYKIKPMFKMVF